MSRRTLAVVVTCGLAGTAFLRLVLAALLGGPCSFDPPPGDVTAMTLVNDTDGPVQFVECNDNRCSEHGKADGTIAAGGKDAYWNHEDCGREPVGILDPTGSLLGCIVLPADDPPRITTWKVSQKVGCSGPIG